MILVTCRSFVPQRHHGIDPDPPAGLPGRSYTSLAQARADGNNARVWGGMHYPSTVSISDANGAAIAAYVNATAMLPLRR